MKCWGRTKNLKRCERPINGLFCHDHRYQPLIYFVSLLSLISTLTSIFDYYIKPILSEDKNLIPYKDHSTRTSKIELKQPASDSIYNKSPSNPIPNKDLNPQKENQQVDDKSNKFKKTKDSNISEKNSINGSNNTINTIKGSVQSFNCILYLGDKNKKIDSTSSKVITANLFYDGFEEQNICAEIDWGDRKGWEILRNHKQNELHFRIHEFKNAGIKVVKYRVSNKSGFYQEATDSIKIISKIWRK